MPFSRTFQAWKSQHFNSSTFQGLYEPCRRNIHPLTPIVVINHPLSPSSIYYNPQHPPCSIYTPDSLFPKSLAKFSLVYLLAWHSPLHTPYTTCPYHCNLSCCSIEIMSSNLSLSLDPLLGTLSCGLTPHIHLTILISASCSATSFSFLEGQISLPCNILLRTQLLYNLPLTINYISLLVSYGTNCLNLFQPINSAAAFSKVPRKILGKLLILGATDIQVATSSRGYSATVEHSMY